jgi:Tfp pilus assembly protein PilN
MKAVNLIPPEQRRGAGGLAGRTGGIAYVVIGALVVIVALGVVYAVAVHDVAKHKAALARLTDKADAIQAQIGSLEPYQAFASLTQSRLSSVVSLAAQRFDWPLAMQQVARSLPSNVTLTTLSGTATGGGANGTTGAGGSTGLTGVSGSASTVTAASGAIVNAPTLSVAGCAIGSLSAAQDTVATTLATFRRLTGVTGATVQTYGPQSSCDGVSFGMTITYANVDAIPSPPIKAGHDTTAGG